MGMVGGFELQTNSSSGYFEEPAAFHQALTEPTSRKIKGPYGPFIFHYLLVMSGKID